MNAELSRGGHPLWLYDRHPEVRSKDASGAFAMRRGDGEFVPSQLDPRYLDLVSRWYGRVIRVLRPFGADNGGPIILMQVDNEPNLAFSYSVEGSLYDRHVLEEGGLWAKWLGREGVEPPRSGRATTPDEARLAADWLRFKKGHVFEFIRRLAEDVRRHGLDLPFTMNEPINNAWAWRSGDHASFARFFKGTGLRMFSSGHCYLHYGGEQNLNGAPVTLARIEAVKMSTLEGPPSIYEIGSWYTVPSGALGSCNWDIMTKLLIGSGMNGYSVYVYNDGRLPPGYGRIGASYDWHTAIGHDGRRSGPFEVLREINRFVDCWQQQILGGSKLFDVTVGLSDELPMIAANVVSAARLSAGAPGRGRAHPRRPPEPHRPVPRAHPPLGQLRAREPRRPEPRAGRPDKAADRAQQRKPLGQGGRLCGGPPHRRRRRRLLSPRSHRRRRRQSAAAPGAPRGPADRGSAAAGRPRRRRPGPPHDRRRARARGRASTLP